LPVPWRLLFCCLVALRLSLPLPLVSPPCVSPLCVSPLCIPLVYPPCVSPLCISHGPPYGACRCWRVLLGRTSGGCCQWCRAALRMHPLAWTQTLRRLCSVSGCRVVAQWVLTGTCTRVCDYCVVFCWGYVCCVYGGGGGASTPVHPQHTSPVPSGQHCASRVCLQKHMPHFLPLPLIHCLDLFLTPSLSLPPLPSPAALRRRPLPSPVALPYSELGG
jgi:hypothetical protein